MNRGCRLGAFLLLGCIMWLWSSATAEASIELRIDGRSVAARPALALLGSGLGVATPVLQSEFGFVVDDNDFPVVELRYGDRSALVVVDDRRAVVDSAHVELQLPPRVQGDTLFIPLHLVADMVNLRVNWDIVSGTLALEHRDRGVIPIPRTAGPAATPGTTATSAPAPGSVVLMAPSGTTPPATAPSGTTPPATAPSETTEPAEAENASRAGTGHDGTAATTGSPGTTTSTHASTSTPTTSATPTEATRATSSASPTTTTATGEALPMTSTAAGEALTTTSTATGGASPTTFTASGEASPTTFTASGEASPTITTTGEALPTTSTASGEASVSISPEAGEASSTTSAVTGEATGEAASLRVPIADGAMDGGRIHSLPTDGIWADADAISPAILLDVGVGVVDGRVELEVVTDKPVEARAMFLPNPDRLVVDVPHAVLGTGWRTMPGDGKIIEQIRAGTTEDGDVRLVADLTAPTGYELRFDDEADGFTVRLNHQLHLLSAEATAIGGLTIRMGTTGSLRYSAFTLREPARFVIDLAGATIDGPQELAPEGQFASAVRLSQYEHDVVRIVLELRGPSTAALFAGRLDGGVEGELQPGADGTFSLTMHPLTGFAVERTVVEQALGTLKYVGLMQYAGTEFILIEADAPLDPDLRRFRDPERLVLDFPGTQVERSLGLVGGPAEPGVVGTVRAGQAEPDVSRIVVETKGIVEQHLLFSKDRTRAVLALRPSELGGRTIVVDPGHGGRDPGAIGHSGTYEKDVTLPIALHVARMLEQAGATVVLTRDGDVTVELSSRSGLANTLGADAFVSIHADAVGFGRVASGTSTFYHPENGNGPSTSVNRRYAQSLQQELLGALRLQDRGVHERAFHVVLNTKMPSALVEVGFIDNPDEEKLLIDPDFQARAAAGIVQGILRFFSEEQRLAVPDARQQWTVASERAVEQFLQRGEVPGDAMALVPTAVLGAVPEPVPHDAGF